MAGIPQVISITPDRHRAFLTSPQTNTVEKLAGDRGTSWRFGGHSRKRARDCEIADYMKSMINSYHLTTSLFVAIIFDINLQFYYVFSK